MKLITVVGARPQFIKAAVVSRAISEFNAKLPQGTDPIDEIIIHTGQHHDENMSRVFFEEMFLPEPKYNLGIQGGTHGAMTGRMLEKIEEVIINENPDMVLVYGDTNSTLAGALAAAKMNIPVAHVEAGLRSYNMEMPEEINRILTDRISTLLFCPTAKAVINLEREGILIEDNNTLTDRQQVTALNIGDVMFDAMLFYKKVAKPTTKLKNFVDRFNGKYYLATIHRAENTDNPENLISIIMALENISAQVPVIIPLHPRTRKMLAMNKVQLTKTYVTEPVGYFDMLYLLNNCRAVFTDSGGVQKEAYFFEKPCVILRQQTEWTELVDNGFSTLTGADCQKILEAEQQLSLLNDDYSLKLYGDGNAGEKIVEFIHCFFDSVFI